MRAMMPAPACRRQSRLHENPCHTGSTHAERLHPKNIELGLDRVRAVAERLGLLRVPGDHGGRHQRQGLDLRDARIHRLRAGYRAAVFTSPHLVRFEERLRLSGEAVEADRLAAAFRSGGVGARRYRADLFRIHHAGHPACMAASKPDVAILEVGLGGRLDAVNIIDADCAVITSIDLDHMEFLGPDRESIGFEKAGIMRAGRPAIVCDPVPPQSVIAHAEAIGADLWRVGRDFNVSGDKQQWGWSGRGRRYSGLAYPALRGANQLVNAAGVLAALESLRQKLPVTAQAVRTGLAMVELPGRFQIVPGEPTLVLDVAHNAHAVAALAENLDAMGFYPDHPCRVRRDGRQGRGAHVRAHRAGRSTAGTSPICRRRAPRARAICWPLAGAEHARHASGSAHAAPMEALQAAIDRADPADRIVVFGSFFTVGGVLEHGTPRLRARHLSPGA